MASRVGFIRGAVAAGAAGAGIGVPTVAHSRAQTQNRCQPGGQPRNVFRWAYDSTFAFASDASTSTRNSFGGDNFRLRIRRV